MGDGERGQAERQIGVNGEFRPYVELMAWISLATMTLYPATAAPVGRTPEGLPVGVQIVGPYLHDRTTLRLAAIISDLCGGCPRPALAG